MLFHAKNVKSAGILPECRYTISQETTGAREKTDAPNPERDRRGDRLFDRHRVTRAERLAPNHARNAPVRARLRETDRLPHRLPPRRADRAGLPVRRLLRQRAAAAGGRTRPSRLPGRSAEFDRARRAGGALVLRRHLGHGPERARALLGGSAHPAAGLHQYAPAPPRRHLHGRLERRTGRTPRRRTPARTRPPPHRPLRRNLKLLRSVQLEQREP